MTIVLLSIRSFFFLAGYTLLTIIWGSLSLVVGPFLPYPIRFRFIIVNWSGMVLFWLRCTCGVHIRVQGRENIPSTPFVVLCKHESTIEALFLQSVLIPVTAVIKRELLYVPFFGWAFALVKPIAISRANAKAAFREVMQQGRKRLEDGISVLMFPEGTRLEPGRVGEFFRGGAALAVAAGVPVLPIFHNSGSCWPPRQWLKHPGAVNFVIGEPINTEGKTSLQVSDTARAWMLEQLP